MFLIAPTEPPEIQVLGTRSPVPESVGCDVLWAGRNGLCGVQRKTVSDLIASVQNDDRLGKEFEQMRKLAWKGLVVEGTPQWTRDGYLLDGHKSWSAKQHRGVLMSAQMKGVVVVQSRNHLDTCDAIHHMYEWSNKQDHASSLLYRGNGKSEWGELTDESTAVHLMSAFPGIGTELARRIFQAFGRVPIQWSVSEEELAAIHGIGKKKLESLMKLMSVTNVTEGSDE